MTTVKNYLSLVKFSHTIFAMPFALIGFFVALLPVLAPHLKAAGAPRWFVDMHYQGFSLSAGDPASVAAGKIALRLLLVILCMVFARSAAMAFNRYLDRQFDARNPRTAIREIPKGIISADSALRFVVICSLLFVATCWFINPLCFALSPVALFVILFYSYTKRFTAFCHIVLGIGLSLAPIGAFLAVTGYFATLPLLFSGAVICWVSGFDIIYAMQDVAFDESQKLFSVPVALGKKNALILSTLLHVVSAGFVLAAGIYGEFGWWYWIGVAVFSGMLIYQHAIVRPNDLSKVNIAFMTANGIASVVFASFVIADIFLTQRIADIFLTHRF